MCALLAYGKETEKQYIENNLKTLSYAIDTEASAVVLYENTSIEITEEYVRFSKKEKVHRIIKILRPEALVGVSNVANIKIYLYNLDNGNYISNVKATTYNVGKDSMLQTLLKPDEVYQKNIQGNLYEVTFSMPAVQVGSIIEYYYERVTAYGASTLTWHLQGEYPKLVTEYEISYPNDFAFTTVSNLTEKPKDYQSIDEARQATDNFCRVFNKFKYSTIQQRLLFWHRKNVTALKHEPLVYNHNNYEERIDLIVTGYQINKTVHKVSNNWEKVNSEFWDKDKGDIGDNITGSNKFLADVVDSLSSQLHSPLELAKGIYTYVRSNMQCNPDKAYSLSRRGLNVVFKNKVGNIFEVNMLLAAMLVKANIEASPVLVSTSKNQSLTPLLPVKDNINYMVVVAHINGQKYMLDATDKNNHFGILPVYCYNGFAWVLGDVGYSINLSRDLLEEKRVAAVKISDFTDSTANLQIMLRIGNVKSMSLRQHWATDEQKKQEYLTEYEQQLPAGTVVTKRSIDNLNDPDTNLVLHFDCVMDIDKTSDMLHLKNELTPSLTSNPLKSTKRKYPIEFPYKYDNSYYISIALPENMEPELLPKPTKMSYDDNKITYERTITYNPGLKTLTASVKYTANSSTYEAGSHESLANFFKNIIEEGEQVISLKKKMK